MSFFDGIVVALNEIWRRVTDTRPLMSGFPKNVLAELYVARTILFASFTLGIRFGAFPVVYHVPLDIFGSTLVFLFTYFFIPLVGLSIAITYTKSRITVYEFRVLILIWAFLCGTMSMVSNIHYQLTPFGTPTYFMPILVGLTAQAIGDLFDNNRVLLVGTSVGSAFAVSLGLLVLTGEQLTISCLLSVTLCALNAIISLQLMIYDLIEEGAKINPSLTHAFGVILTMLNFLIVTRITGRYSEDPARNDAYNHAPLYSIFSV